MPDTKLKEPILKDNYPVYVHFLYVVEAEYEVPGSVYDTYFTIVRSDIQGNVKELWHDLVKKGWKGIVNIRRCDIAGRNLWHMTV